MWVSVLFPILHGLEFESLINAHIIAGHILIVGSDLGLLDEHDHDRCLLQVLNWCREVSLKLNAAKCIFKAKQVVFCGHLAHTNGLSPDPWKVQVISNLPVPSNKTELQSYIGMCNFLSSYAPHLTNKLFVLWQLTAKDSDFVWTVSHTKVFECSKDAILSCATLIYFDDAKPCTIQVDASNIGVGAALIQEGKYIEYHNRALTSTQQWYSNIEHEAYALVNGVEHFHHYVFGKLFEVQTDHQPLVQLNIKPLAELSPKLQHLLLKVNQYKYTVKYVRQTGVMITDCLSCIVCQDTAEDDETLNLHVTALTMFQDGKLQDIHCQTLLDPQLVKLARVIQNGWVESWGELDADLHALWIHRFNMHITNGIIMNGSWIVIPKTLQQEYLQCLHMGHLGISKWRARVKMTVFWPNIDKRH